MKKGTIKVTVMYPNEEGKKFDMDYYENKHIPMVGGLLGDALLNATVEKGIAGGAPGAPALYSATSSLYFNSIEEFQNSFGPNTEAIMADVPNYTDINPVIQISEVVI